MIGYWNPFVIYSISMRFRQSLSRRDQEMKLGNVMKKFIFIALLILAFHLSAQPVSASNPGRRPAESARPNVVLILADNLGIGEVGVYGGARGVPTPTLDGLAKQGVRFTNFNVEYHCVVSRIALLTGRYGLRTGDGLTGGMTLWEVTIAEALRSIGYATGIFGKYHVGGDNWKGRREPTQQGFDEWYGIPDTSHTAQFTSFEGFDAARNEVPFIWEAKAGELSRRVKPYDLETRRVIDREAAERGIAFMEKNVKKGKPFFFYFPVTQIHFPIASASRQGRNDGRRRYRGRHGGYGLQRGPGFRIDRTAGHRREHALYLLRR